MAAWLVPALVSAAARDPALQLPLPRIIDPVLVFGTYLGGSLDEQLVGVGLDDGGNVYVVGTTASNDFPTVPSLPHPTPPPKLLFVSKFDPTGSTLLSSIVFGGFTTDPDVNGTLTAAAVDGAGNVYLTGGTPGGLPTLNAAQPTYAGGGDAFVAKVDATGALAFSTYLGGGGFDMGTGVAVDAAGRVHVVGSTSSGGDSTTPFPVKAASQSSYGGNGDVFVAELDATGALQYATYLGGEGGDSALAIATDGSGDTWVAGETRSSAFPTTPNAWRPGSLPGPFLRSSDGGETWAPSPAPMREASVTAVAVDPTDSNTVYVGTNGVFGGLGGIYRSTDGGDTWALLYRPASPTVGVVALAVDPARPATVYAATAMASNNGSLLRTRDGGALWAIANVGLPGAFDPTDLIVDPRHSDTVYALSHFSLYRSDDGADHWSAIAVPDALQAMGGFSPFRLHLAVDTIDPDHLVLAGFQRVAQSFDRGQTWAVAADAFGTCEKGICNVIGALALDPTDPRIIYVAGTFGFARTADGGQHWDMLFGHCLQDTRALLVDPLHPTTLYGVASPYGLARSTDGGTSWTPVAGAGDVFGLNALVLVPGPSPRFYAGLTRLVSEFFVTRFDVSGTPVFSTYTGLSPSPPFSPSLDVDQRGSVYLPRLKLDPTGMPQPFALPSHLDPAAVSALRIDTMGHVHVLGQAGDHAFAAEFDLANSERAVCSLLAGSGTDQASAIALDADGDTYVGLTTSSTDLAVPGAHQPTNAGGKDAFVAKIAAGVGDTITNCPAPSTTTTSLPLPSCRAQCGDGLSGAQCRLNDLLAGPLCGDEAVDAKLQAFITRKLSGVQALLAKAAATTGRKRHRALKGMDHRLAAIQNRTRRDVRKREVSFRCGYIIIAQEIMPLRQTIMAIR